HGAVVFFFQAEDGIRDRTVTGVQTCALPIFKASGGKWLLITESAIDETYCGTHLGQRAEGGTYRIKFPDPGEGRGVGAANPASRSEERRVGKEGRARRGGRPRGR